MSVQGQVSAILERNAGLPREELERYQQRLLERLCRHAATNVAGYRETVRGLFDGGDPAAGDWRPERWSELPILTRGEMAAQTADFQAAGADEREYRSGETSGSTGTPFSYRRSVIGNFASVGVADRAFRKHGFDLTGKFADIRVVLMSEEESKRLRRWNSSADAGLQYPFEIRRPVEEQWAWLQEVQPDYLMSYPSNLRALAALAEGRTDRLPLKACVASAEILTDDTRERVRAAFGAETMSLYGLRELGHVATGCPHSHQLHVASDVTLVEVMKDDGAPAVEGEAGRVVATSLYNHAMPFIRYATGDYAEVGEACGCGWSLPTLKRILGRRRNRCRLGDGREIWPALLLEGMESVLEVDDFQLIQTAPDAFEFRYVRPAGSQDIESGRVASMLNSAFGREVAVTVNRTERIMPSGYAKRERFISEYG